MRLVRLLRAYLDEFGSESIIMRWPAKAVLGEKSKNFINKVHAGMHCREIHASGEAASSLSRTSSALLVKNEATWSVSLSLSRLHVALHPVLMKNKATWSVRALNKLESQSEF
jgi:hypothetical protein